MISWFFCNNNYNCAYLSMVILKFIPFMIFFNGQIEIEHFARKFLIICSKINGLGWFLNWNPNQMFKLYWIIVLTFLTKTNIFRWFGDYGNSLIQKSFVVLLNFIQKKNAIEMIHQNLSILIFSLFADIIIALLNCVYVK